VKIEDLTDKIPLRWVKNDVEGAKFAFGGGRVSPELTYLGAPIHTDFELSYENLAPRCWTLPRHWKWLD
jgi:hypothetical protein